MKLNDTGIAGIALSTIDGTVWSVDASQNVYFWDAANNRWLAAPKGVSSGGSTFFLGTANVDSGGDHTVYQFDSKGQLSSTNGIGVDLGAAEGTVWAANTFHDVHHWDAVNNVWVLSNSSIVGPDGSVFFLGANAVDSYGNYEAYRFGTDGSLSNTAGSGMTLELQSGNVLLVQDFFDFLTGFVATTYYWGPKGTWLPAAGSGVNPVQGSIYYNSTTVNSISVPPNQTDWLPSGGNSTFSGGINVGNVGAINVQGIVTAPVVVDGGTIDIAPGATVIGDLAINTGNGILDGAVNGSVTVSGGGSMQGSGNVSGTLAAQANTVTPGTIAILLPGDSPGILTVGGLSLDSSGEIQEKIYGPVAGSTYSQIAVKGSVALGGATLKVDLGGYQPTVGQQFIIIDNQGANPVNGTFNNLPEGGLLTVGNAHFRISYKGGDGNDVTLTAVAVPTLSITDAGGGYNGNPFSASATAVGVDGKTAVNGSFSYAYYAGSSATGTALSSVPTNAGTYTVVATFTSSDSNYLGGTAQTTFTIAQATPSLGVTDAGGVFNGNSFPAATSALGVDAKTPVNGSFTLAYYAGSSASGTSFATAPSNAGTYTVAATFTSTDSNYTGGTAQKTFVISQAKPTVSVADAGGTYNGNPFSAVATTVGVDGKTAVSGSFSYAYYAGTSATGTASATAPSNAGTYTVAVTFTSSDNNYSGGSAQIGFTIKQAAPAVSIADTGGAYNGQPFPASGTALGLDGKTPVSGSFTYAYFIGSSATGVPSANAPSNAGTYTAAATFTSSDPNFTGGSAHTTFTINPLPKPPPSPSPAPVPSLPTLQVPPLLAFIDSLLSGTETINSNGTETIADSFFGIPLLVSTFDRSGKLVSVSLFGFDVTFLFG